MSVWVLYDNLERDYISLHASQADAEKARDAALKEAERQHRQWWADFGVGGKYGDLQGPQDRSETLEEHLRKEREVVEESIVIYEEETS